VFTDWLGYNKNRNGECTVDELLDGVSFDLLYETQVLIDRRRARSKRVNARGALR
jgi:hypothetical protein